VAGCLTDAREIIGRRMTAADVMAEVEKDVIFYDESGGGATFSGGEPLMQPEFLSALLNQCRAAGIHTAVDTTCYAEPDVIRRVAQVTDLFLCDVKHMNSDRHEQYTGMGNEKILENIRMLAEAGAKITIRVPVISGFNEDAANMEETARFVQSLPGVRRVDILPYNRGGLAKSIRLTGAADLMQAEPASDGTMANIADTFSNYGFEVKIGG
jgi:pyruvate formate lyase activating enzyme